MVRNSSRLLRKVITCLRIARWSRSTFLPSPVMIGAARTVPAPPGFDFWSIASRAEDDRSRIMNEFVRYTESIWCMTSDGRRRSVISSESRFSTSSTRQGGTICSWDSARLKAGRHGATPFLDGRTAATHVGHRYMWPSATGGRLPVLEDVPPAATTSTSPPPDPASSAAAYAVISVRYLPLSFSASSSNGRFPGPSKAFHRLASSF